MITFTINENPIPYLRLTQGQLKLLKMPLWKVRRGPDLERREAIERYLQYKNGIQADHGKSVAHLDPKRKIYMGCLFYFRNGIHGDPDNCFKAIADGLFPRDKNVGGLLDFFFDKTRPRSEVFITDSRPEFFEWIPSLVKGGEEIGQGQSVGDSDREETDGRE